MKIFLRPITLEDAHYIISWRNAENVKNHCLNKQLVTEESNRKFFKDNIETGKYKQFMVEKMDDDFSLASYPIATVYLKDMDTYNNRCELCIFTSTDEEWNSTSQTKAVKMLLEKAFNEYNMHKVYTYVFLDNKDEIDLLEKAGFKQDALFTKEAKNTKGEYVDMIRMSLEG